MAKTGAKSKRGQAEFYDEIKTEQVMMLLTPTAKKGLDRLARSLGLSRSELGERLGRGILKLEGVRKGR